MNKKITPWYKEFWAWVAILLPASVIIACFFTVRIAFQNADSVVDASWRKNGLSVEKKIEQETAANLLGLEAALSISRKTGAVLLTLSSQLKTKAVEKKLNALSELTLSLEHPTQPQYDQKIDLKKTSKGLFKGEIHQFYSGVRYATLASKQGAWQLKSKITLFMKAPQWIKG